ncbi:MAG: hypothetical protein WBR23_05975 [Candidatus Dormiibacterota bacterium]
MSTAVEDFAEADGSGLALDETHTLVAVEPEDLETLWRPEASGALGWLLFRSGSSAGSAGAASAGEPPELWFEFGGRRIAATLEDSAGWHAPGGAAVALFEVQFSPPIAASVDDHDAAAACGIRLADSEVVAQLTRRWVERLLAAAGGPG